jgi:hypothetical protein
MEGRTSNTSCGSVTAELPSMFNVSTKSAASSSLESSHIVLPVGYQLVRWRVSHGTAVHTGESVAIISPINSTNVHCNTINNNSTESTIAQHHQTLSSSHKRPSKRKRPQGSIASVPTATASCTLEILAKDGSNKTSANAAVELEAQQSSIRVHSSNNVDIVAKSSIGKKSNTTISASLQDAATTIVAQADGICHINDTPTIASLEDIILGWIDPCRHPTIISGMCAVCGTIVNRISSSLPNVDMSTNAAAVPAGAIDSNRGYKAFRGNAETIIGS